MFLSFYCVIYSLMIIISEFVIINVNRLLIIQIIMLLIDALHPLFRHLVDCMTRSTTSTSGWSNNDEDVQSSASGWSNFATQERFIFLECSGMFYLYIIKSYISISYKFCSEYLKIIQLYNILTYKTFTITYVYCVCILPFDNFFCNSLQYFKFSM